VANNPAATLAAIAPASGDRQQTLAVVFTGSGFIAGVSSVNVGDGITVNGTAVDSDTQITANITITAAAAVGAREFSVTNAGPGGATSGAQTFTVNNPAPTLASLAPTSGNRLQNLNVVFTGTGFADGVSTVDVGAGITVNSVTVSTSTTLTANITILGSAAFGTRNFTVVNPAPGGGTTTAQTFTVANNPAPTLATLAPATGSRLQTLDVVLTGSGFLAGITSVDVGAGITLNNATIDSPTQITVNVTIGAGAALGARSFMVTNDGPGGGNASQTFGVENPAATLTAIAPAAANRLETLDVVFTGSNFIAGVTTINVGNDITVNTLTVDGPTQVTANITIGAAATTGARSFTVSNAGPGGGTSVAQTFTINNPAPTLGAIAPATGERQQTLDVVFTGSGFIDGVSTVTVGPDITLNSTTIDSPTQITVNITIGDAAALGARDFSVTNSPPGGGASATQSFTVENPTPTITAVTPSTAATATLQASTVITGTGFIAGVTTVDFVDGDVVITGTVTVDSPTQITVIDIQYPENLGPSDLTRAIRVTNAGRTPATHAVTVTP
jgi:hypothetical protein